jgi:tetratricopeptide (TPR) repeat protein
MRKHQLRGAARITFRTACTCFVVFVAFAIAKLVVATPSKATSERLSTAVAISAIFGAIAALVSAALAVQQARATDASQQRDLVPPHLLQEDVLVDRGGEMTALVETLSRCRVVNCHGRRGAGKSFLLEHLADVVNGHRPSDPDHPKPTKTAAALYFDLADAVGFDQIRTQVCQAALGDGAASWLEFVAYVTRMFDGRSVLLILDNANTPGLWPSLGEAAYQYLAGRPADKLILGSIDPVVLSNLQVEHISFPGLDLHAVSELVAGRSLALSEEELFELYDQCSGLPLYVRLLTANGGELLRGQRTAVIDSVIDVQLMPELAHETRQLLSYVSLFGLLTRQIPVSALEDCPLAHLDSQIEVAEQWSLITPVPGHGRRLVKIHDLVRDAALRVLTLEVSEAALQLFERAFGDGRTVDAAVYAMFADPDEIGAARFDEVTNAAIRSAVERRNHALLSTLHSRARHSTRVLRFISADAARRDLFCYGRASELASLGRYSEAQEALDSSSIVRSHREGDDARSPLQPDMRFMQADIAHLQNRYDEAAQMFEDLGSWAAADGRLPLRARCTWGHGHVLRHQGRDLDRAISLFAQAIEQGAISSELFAKVYSVTGATGIKVFWGTVPESEERLLAEAEAEIAATSAHDGYMLEVWKSQAQVAWFRGAGELAFEIIEAAIARALAANDRLLYNLYFERAEFRRLTGTAGDALEDYARVLRFGTGNGDRNLISNALLGSVLVDLWAGRWLHHESRAHARASAVRAREIALAADIQVTAQCAERVVALLDEADVSVPPPRLVLF